MAAYYTPPTRPNPPAEHQNAPQQITHQQTGRWENQPVYGWKTERVCVGHDRAGHPIYRTQRTWAITGYKQVYVVNR